MRSTVTMRRVDPLPAGGALVGLQPWPTADDGPAGEVPDWHFVTGLV
ncbi:MAG TPA: hypothetical protein VF444_21345 [Pseudonocardiaceae bacterium]